MHSIATHKWQLPRRTFLKGLGTALALPMLEAMSPTARALAAAAREPNKSFPLRMAYVYVPNGKNMADWTPDDLGTDYKLPYILEPLKSVKNDFQVVSGLAHAKARPNGDGPGDHARANASFLTGAQARKTAGADIRAGISVDQVAAQKNGKFTKLPSLELSCDKGRQAGSCDSGYSCIYQFNIAWKSETQPLAPDVDPRSVFERLFGHGNKAEQQEGRIRRELYNKSILDSVLEDANQLKSNLGTTDRRKLDEYLEAVRELEERIQRAEKFARDLPEFKMPSNPVADYEQHIRLMYDLMALAFQTDTTRISTFMVAHDGSNRAYPNIGVSEGHHDLSHHGGKEEKKKKIAQINHFHTTQFAYLLEKLKSIKEGDGTLLDNCMVVYGSAIADGNAHAHHDLPVLLAGKGGGAFKPGRHIRYPKDTPMTNMFLTMLDQVGVRPPRLGDSTGKLAGLS
jgi:hypothetical protein